MQVSEVYDLQMGNEVLLVEDGIRERIHVQKAVVGREIGDDAEVTLITTSGVRIEALASQLTLL